MDDFSQVSSQNTVMTQRIHARFTLSIITFIKVRAAEKNVQYCTRTLYCKCSSSEKLMKKLPRVVLGLDCKR